jgi:hypothetical protein
MVASALPSERLHELSLRQVQVKHALKTALGCTLAAFLTYAFHLPAGQFAPIFVFMLFTLGMPSPRRNWLYTQLAIAFSGLVSALLLIALHAVPALHLAVNLLWIFFCLLFTNWISLAANLAAMISAIGIFVFLDGSVGDTLLFYFAYALEWLVAGVAVLVVHSLLWPLDSQILFLDRLAAVYAQLEAECRRRAHELRGGVAPSVDAAQQEWAPFRPLRQMLAPELRRAHHTSNPFARMILACRGLNLRLWFFGQAVAPVLSTATPPEARGQLASHLDQCADQLHALLEAVLLRRPVPSLASDFRIQEILQIPESPPAAADEGALLLAHGIPQSILHRLTDDLRTVTTCHNALLARMRHGRTGALVAFSPLQTGARLIDGTSVRAATKLVLLLLLLLAEEALLGFPGGTQVAFFAVFFASTGNLGRQNKTDLFGLLGIFLGIVYGIVAAYLSSSDRLLGFLLLLFLVFLGEFLANLAYQKLPRFSNAGLQGGLAICFAYLATTGPEWGSFEAVRTRFAGLIVCGFTAVIVHAYLWPVLPMRQLRALIAAALRDTAASLDRLFAGPPRSRWDGSPPSLEDTVTRARDLLDDARYLPGSEHADPTYLQVLACLQEIDVNLEYIHFLLHLEPEHEIRELFFQVVADYAQEAKNNLERIAQQLQPSERRAARLEPVRWQPDTVGRWQRSSPVVRSVPEAAIDPTRPALIAHCLDRVASAAERISALAGEINRRNSR